MFGFSFAPLAPRIPPLARQWAVGLFACALSANAPAFGSLDPFATEALTTPPRLAIADEPSFAACRELPVNAAYGLIDVVDRALCNNPKTHELWANARNQAALVGVARAQYLPGLTGSISGTRTVSGATTAQGQSASVSLSWLLADFGTRAAGLESARQLLAAANLTLDATVQTVFLNAMQAYYNAQAARAALSAAVESEKASRESLAAAETRYAVGTATPADRLQARTAWSQAVLNRIKTEGTLQTAYGALAAVMGLDAHRPVSLDQLSAVNPDASFVRDLDALIAEARNKRPDLAAAEAQLQASQANVDVARGAGLPTLSLGAGSGWSGSASYGNSYTNPGSSIGLTLSMPLFSGFDTTYRVRAAQAKVAVASAQRDALRLQVALDVWSSYQSLVTATQSVRTAADLLASAEASERMTLGRYKAGVGTLIDLLNAQSALAAARVQGIQAALDWRVSRAALAKAIGTLDGRLLNPAIDSTP